MPDSQPLPVIAALLTCHNRRAMTLRCLELLHRQEGLDTLFRLEVFLVDDGSTDGTGAAVKAAFPAVHIIPGDGNLFWNGGMRKAWQAALPGNHGFYLWLNDDSLLYPQALRDLLGHCTELAARGQPVGALAGTMVDPETRLPTYGGKRITSRFNRLRVAGIPPAKEIQACDYLNGNLVLVPASSVQAIGILHGFYKHGFGDYDYSYRLRQAGLPCLLAPGIYGECPANAALARSMAPATFAERVKDLREKARLLPPADHLYFIRHCGGLFWPVWWLKVQLRAYCPALWVLLTRKTRHH